VHGLNTSDMIVVTQLLRDVGQGAAADLLAGDTKTLLATHAERIQNAQNLMREFGAQGVPTLLVTDDVTPLLPWHSFHVPV
jgi:putative protein-disulfide isomerase